MITRRSHKQGWHSAIKATKLNANMFAYKITWTTNAIMTNLQICAPSVGDKLAWQYGNQTFALYGKGKNGSENTCPHCNIITKYHRHEYVIDCCLQWNLLELSCWRTHLALSPNHHEDIGRHDLYTISSQKMPCCIYPAGLVIQCEFLI